MRLFARHAQTICDFNALRDLLCSMGASGLKACPSCQHITKDDVAQAAPGGELQPLSSLDMHKWKKHTDKNMWSPREQKHLKTHGFGPPASRNHL